MTKFELIVDRFEAASRLLYQASRDGVPDIRPYEMEYNTARNLLLANDPHAEPSQ